MKTSFAAALLAATALAAPAYAQEPAPAAVEEPLPPEAPLSPEDAAAQVEFLKAQVEALQSQVQALTKSVASNAPSFSGGAPRLSNSAGFNFKVRGRLHYDAGYVTNPNDAVATKNLGFNSRVRRARIGAQGAFPGGFNYVLEFDLANASVGYADLYLAYKPTPESPFTFTVGHHYPFLGLEQITSSNFVTTIERAQFTEAFGYGRRLGASVNYASGDLRLDVGVFNDTINAGLDNDDWTASTRLTYAPQALGGRLHFGANYQYRKFQTNTQNFQYRVRPGTQVTDIRFADTGTLAAEGDQIFGLEAAGIFGPLHVAVEGAYNKVDALRPGNVFTDGDTAQVAGGTTLFANKDPSFFGAYAEVGYFLTEGDTRGYSGGKFDRVRPKNGFDKGGPGAIQINGRIDYLDLTDGTNGGVSRTNSATGTVTNLTPSQFVNGELNGGEQWLYSANLIWTPIDYIRFLLQYSHASVEGGPRAAAIRPLSTAPRSERKYGVDFIGVRSQFDF